METKKTKKQGFFKRNAYYFIVAFVLLAAISVSVALLVTGKDPIQSVDKPNSSDGTLSDGTSSGVIDDKPTDNPSDNGNDKPADNVGGDDGGADKPTEKPITFLLPVEGATVIQNYTAASVAYNPTLNIYTGHLAVDFAAAEGTNVVAVYGGTIESVNTSYLTGTSVTIDHGDGLKTVYNSIEPIETLTEGAAVKQGDVLGVVSTNNKQEYKSGPHLHFEVYENGKKADPSKYLSITQK